MLLLTAKIGFSLYFNTRKMMQGSHSHGSQGKSRKNLWSRKAMENEKNTKSHRKLEMLP